MEPAEVTAEEGQNSQPQNSLKKIEGQQVFRMAEFHGSEHLAQSQRVATREHMEEKWREYACATAADPSDSKKLSKLSPEEMNRVTSFKVATAQPQSHEVTPRKRFPPPTPA